MSTGLKWVEDSQTAFCPGAPISTCADSTICFERLPSFPLTQKGPPPGSPSFLTTPHTLSGLLSADTRRADAAPREAFSASSGIEISSPILSSSSSSQAFIFTPTAALEFRERSIQAFQPEQIAAERLLP
jgi:hypothetical protein